MKTLISFLYFFQLWKAKNYCDILKIAYPSTVKSCIEALVLDDDTKIPFYNNKLKRTINKMRENPDLYSIFFYTYRGEKREDAGRIRIYPLLKLTYGASKQNIIRNLEKIKFYNQAFLFNKKNGALKALKKVFEEVKTLLIHKPYLFIYFQKIYTFNYRNIRGTKLLSPHSFGIAIDLNPTMSLYWRWNKNWKKVKEIPFPEEIVEIFEKYGFIWGGRWEHYDSMHFEYRPEFFLKKFIGEDH